jgi:Predicted membrane protein
MKFVFVGICNTLVSYLLFALFIKVSGEENYQASLFASWFFSSFISFVLQKTIVFQTKGNWLKEYVKCMISWSVGYGINALSLELIVQYFAFPVLIGQLIAIVLTALCTFVLFKYFAFNRSK